MNGTNGSSALLFRAGGHRCALELSCVVEIMRPQPVKTIANTPPSISGVSLIRGQAVPVVAVSALINGESTPPRRFVLVHAGKSCVAMAVDEVSGIVRIDSSLRHALPSLLNTAAGEALDAIGALDSELLLVLKSGNFIPEAVWRSLLEQEI